jgi:hypothetical protein
MFINYNTPDLKSGQILILNHHRGHHVLQAHMFDSK